MPPSLNDPAEPVSSIPGAPTADASRRPVLLSIAGFDPSGGAGILADLKTFAAHRVYGMACITALTVQSTQGVRQVRACDPMFVCETLDCLAADASFAAIKVGMLGSGGVAAAVLGWLREHPAIPTVLDPVLKSSSDKELLDESGRGILCGGFLERANWITPNLQELAALTGLPAPGTREETERAAWKLRGLAAKRGNPALKVVVTGGHAAKPDDLLLAEHACQWFTGEWIETTSTHGTGCTFSSALAARVALGDDDLSAVAAAKRYVTEALRNAYPVGKGNGPLNHFWEVTGG